MSPEPGAEPHGGRRGRGLWRIVRMVWVSVGLGATFVVVVWSLIAYRATDVALHATQADSSVEVTHADGVWEFRPRLPPTEPILAFFPGALVDPRAYAPLAHAVASEGFRVFLVELPHRGAFGGAESPELRVRIQRTLDSLDRGEAVVLAGHSRGGVVASTLAARGLPNLGGLVLIGTSHPRDVDLSGLDVPVTKIVGTRDGLASPAKVRANASLLPEHTRWVWIDGGNHSQFGWYGFQPMDRRATLDAAEQRQRMLDGVLALLNAVASASDPGS
jgi:pimeloyl-ACP methyl ester carboxylesterase